MHLKRCKGNKKTPEKEASESKQEKKKKPDESVLKNISFKDLNRMSIGETKQNNEAN